MGCSTPARHGGHLAPSTLARVFTPRGRQPGGRICVSTTYGTPGPCSQRPQEPRSPADGPPGSLDPGAALRYQHAAKDRDRAIADALSDMAERAVTQIKADKPKAMSRRKAAAR